MVYLKKISCDGMVLALFIFYFILSRQSEDTEDTRTTDLKNNILDCSIEELEEILRNTTPSQMNKNSKQRSTNPFLNESNEVSSEYKTSKKEDDVSADSEMVDQTLQLAKQSDSKEYSGVSCTQEKDNLSKPVEVKYVTRLKKSFVNHSSRYDEDHICSIYKNENIIWKFEKDIDVFEFKLPIDHFLGNSFDKNGILCIVKLPKYEMKKIEVDMKKDSSGKFITVVVRSFLFIEYMLDSNSSMYFEKKTGSVYCKVSNYFYFEQIKEIRNRFVSSFSVSKENTRYFDKNTFEQVEREAYRKIPKFYYDTKGEQYVLKHKYRGCFTIKTEMHGARCFNLQVIPMLLCQSNLPLFLHYEKIDYPKYKDVPKAIQELVSYTCKDKMLNSEMNLEKRIRNMTLRLHDAIVDFGQNLEVYKKCSLFENEPEKNQNMFKKYANDECKRIEFLSYLLDLPEKRGYFDEKYQNIFFLLYRTFGSTFKNIFISIPKYIQTTVTVFEKEIK